MNWMPLGENSGVIEFAYELIGYYLLPGHGVVLIDSGHEKSPELVQDLQERNLQVRAVINTHLHFDHTANNLQLQELYGADIISSFDEQTYWERHEKPAFRLKLTEDAAASVDINGISFGLLSTPGHSDGHRCVITPDGLCFLGDAVMSEDRLKGTKFPYMDDIDRAILSMEKIRQTKYPTYIAAHKGIFGYEALNRVVELNVRKELDLYELLRGLVAGDVPEEELKQAYICAAGVPEKYRKQEWATLAAENRIRALVNAGEFVLHDGILSRRESGNAPK